MLRLVALVCAGAVACGALPQGEKRPSSKLRTIPISSGGISGSELRLDNLLHASRFSRHREAADRALLNDLHNDLLHASRFSRHREGGAKAPPAPAAAKPASPPKFWRSLAAGALACLWLLVIAFIPLFLAYKEPQKVTGTHKMLSLGLFAWVGACTYCFVNVFNFTSGMWDGSRCLTIVESAYLLSQIITTVGYGDIIPASSGGRTFMAMAVLVAIVIVAEMVGEFQGALETPSELEEDASPATEGIKQGVSQDLVPTLDLSSVKDPPKKRSSLPHLQFAHCVEKHETHRPDLPYAPLLKALLVFILVDIAGVIFYHYYPGERKELTTAIFMSAVTLSTVGFGSFTPVTEGGMVFGAFWSLIGAAALVKVVTTFGDLIMQQKTWGQLNSCHATSHFKASLAQVRLEDDQRMSKLEFLRLQLLISNLATNEELAAIEELFLQLKAEPHGGVHLSEVRARVLALDEHIPSPRLLRSNVDP